MPSFLTGYSKRKLITISTRPGSDLTDFPVYVPIAGDTDVGAAAAAGGANLRFTADDGTTLLKYGRDAFAISGGAATGRLFVKVPTVAAASSTTIYVYYDNSGAADGADMANVWNANFKLRWSCDQDPSGSSPQITDSTGNASHGTATSKASGDSVAGKVGNALSFSANTYLSDTDTVQTAGQVLTKSGTVTFCLKPTAGANSPSDILRQMTDNFGLGWMFSRNGDNTVTLYINSGTVQSSAATAGSMTAGAWNHVAGFIADDGGTIRLYLNGAADGTGTATTWSTASNVVVGRGFSIFYELNGVLDEVRISSAARSADEIAWEYHNLFDADHCLTFGAEETSGGGGSTPTTPYYRLTGAAA